MTRLEEGCARLEAADVGVLGTAVGHPFQDREVLLRKLPAGHDARLTRRWCGRLSARMLVEPFPHGAWPDAVPLGDALDGVALLVGVEELGDLFGGQGAASHRYAGTFEDAADGLAMDSELGGELVDGRTGSVGVDQHEDLVAGELGEDVGCLRLRLRWDASFRRRRSARKSGDQPLQPPDQRDGV